MLSQCRQRFEFAWGYHLKSGGYKPPFLMQKLYVNRMNYYNTKN